MISRSRCWNLAAAAFRSKGKISHPIKIIWYHDVKKVQSHSQCLLNSNGLMGKVKIGRIHDLSTSQCIGDTMHCANIEMNSTGQRSYHLRCPMKIHRRGQEGQFFRVCRRGSRRYGDAVDPPERANISNHVHLEDHSSLFETF